MSPPPSFKPIQPAPSSKRKPDSPSSSGGKRLRRLKSVTQACNTCRRYKARCDGVRPRCGKCSSKGKPCGYEGEEGQSRQAAMKARLEALEKLVGALQSRSPEEAERLLERIRSADDIVSLSNPDSDDGSLDVTTETTTSRSSSTDPSVVNSAKAPSTASTSSGSASKGTPPTSADRFEVVSPSVPRGQLRPPPSAYLIRLVIPSAQLIQAAIQSFYSSSGKLFHVFSRERIDHYFKSVFSLDGKPNASQRVAICCLSAVAACGVQYNEEDFDEGSHQILYDVARHYFVDAIEEQPLDSIKVCAMLAMYNVLNKATVALAYVEVGLGISQRNGLDTSFYRPPLADDEWADYRKTWRTLMFFSSWLASTLGYISGKDDAVFQKLVPLAAVEPDHGCEIGEIVQAEMTKISLLNAEILRRHLAYGELTSAALDSILQALHDWHSKLPHQMRLANLSRQDLSENVRRSIYHVHLLYLGAIMLLYRRIAAQLAQLYRFGREDDSEERKSREQTLLAQAEKGIMAAKHSSRILGLLLSERGVFKRCWLVIFQAHTSCVVILHSVAQKQLHNFPPSSWAEDLKQAQLCLDALEFCGTIDPVALRFHVRLSGIYSNLAGFPADGPSAMARTEEWVTLPPDFPPLNSAGDSSEPSDKPRSPEYLLTVPPGANMKVTNLSFSLLLALCRPWGDPDERNPCRQTADEGPRRGQTQTEQPPKMMERLEWNLGTTLPFSWDTTGFGIKAGTDLNCFLDSEEPSGWAPVLDIEVFDDEEAGCARPAAATAEY